MKGQILLKALEILKNGIINQVDFLEAVLKSGYGASMGKIDYEYAQIQQSRLNKKNQDSNLKYRRRKLQLFISKMKRDGLIEEVGLKNKKLKISSKGISKISHLKNQLPSRYYDKKKQKNNLTFISFDIPEKLRRKRDWLREAIRNLGFEMIHQSVWMGKTKIPQAFIKDLECLKILDYVEIFEVSKTGTLHRI